MKEFIQLLLATSLLALSGVASALPITGTLEFDGGFTTDTGSAKTATVFTFLNPIDVTAATSTFAPLDGGTVWYNALNINAIPASPLWTATVAGVSYSYDLTSITLDEWAFNTFRLIKGYGVFTVGTETQSGSWVFSSQGAGSGGTFSFSASQVPEPGVALLLGMGLIGFGVSRKLRKTS